MEHISTLSLSLTDSTAVSVSNGTSSYSASKPTTKERNNKKWNDVKHLIKKFYVEEKKPLKETMQKVARDSGFTASERNYKSKLKEWDIEKKIPAKEMAFMVRTAEKRTRDERKGTEFIRKGIKVSQGKMRSFKKRKLQFADEPYQAETPPGISYHTPAPNNFDIDSEILDLEKDQFRIRQPTPTATETDSETLPRDSDVSETNIETATLALGGRDSETPQMDLDLMEVTLEASSSLEEIPQILPKYPGLYSTVPGGQEGELHEATVLNQLSGHEQRAEYHPDYLNRFETMAQYSQLDPHLGDLQFDELQLDDRVEDSRNLENDSYDQDVEMSGLDNAYQMDSSQMVDVSSDSIANTQATVQLEGEDFIGRPSALHIRHVREMWTDETLLEAQDEAEQNPFSPSTEPFLSQPFFNPFFHSARTVAAPSPSEPPYEIARRSLRHLFESFYPSKRDMSKEEWNQRMNEILSGDFESFPSLQAAGKEEWNQRMDELCSLVRKKGTDQRHMSSVFQFAFAATTNYLGLSSNDPEVLENWRRPIWKGFLRYSTSTWLPKAEIVCERFLHSFPRSGVKINRWKCRSELSNALAQAGLTEDSENQFRLAFYDCLYQTKTLPGHSSSELWQELLAGCGSNSRFAYFVVYEASQCFPTDQSLCTDIMRAMRNELEVTDYSRCPKEWIILYLQLFEYNYGSNRVHLRSTPFLPEAALNLSRAVQITNRYCFKQNASKLETPLRKHGWQRRWIKLSNPHYHHEELGRELLQQIKDINERLGNAKGDAWNLSTTKSGSHEGEYELASARRHPHNNRGSSCRKRSRHSSIRTDQYSLESSIRRGLTYSVGSCASQISITAYIS
ncbi:uncharacterized protein LY89DRAFT_681881 [Mollisia scopiformis]|uniref:Clr5 domain-containing protein n=1 Tax=Mollisia scopiformis TaxID=149040 RepID=A0A194XM73_MOLSC|nr:uncharacterized protein LY89DRAFT_681881 [Mollisia scopiformis]KUJ21345.1 hypothetical protein LY89DRAFT_681881 [Mollisia scopiformis]